MSFGTDLQQEREKREVSLEAVAESTKVSSRYLRALEADDTAALPGGVFNKGFVRSYCHHLGLNEQEWLERYASSVQSDEAPDWSTFAKNVKKTRLQTSHRMRRRWWFVLLMLLALGGLCWAAWRYVVKPRLMLTPHSDRRRSVDDGDASLRNDRGEHVQAAGRSGAEKAEPVRQV